MRIKFYEKTLNNQETLINKAVPRYLIIVPEDCKGKIRFDEDTDWFVVTAADRAGVRFRDYKSSVHKITDEQVSHHKHFKKIINRVLLDG